MTTTEKHGPALFDDPVAYNRRYGSFEDGSDAAEHPVIKQRLVVFDDFYKRANLTNARILELGGGPSIYPLISAAKYAESITFTDFGDRNLEFIKKWQRGDEVAFDFSSLASYTVAEIEGDRSEGAVKTRLEEIRRKMTTIRKVDVTDAHPLDESLAGTFDVVSVHYCLLHAVKTHDEYSPVIANLGRYLKAGGILLLSEMLGCFHAQRQFESEKKEGDGDDKASDHGHHHGKDDKERKEGKHDDHHHHHGPDHEAKTKQFIFDSVKRAGFDVEQHRLVTREKPLHEIEGASDAGSWTTVLIMGRKP